MKKKKEERELINRLKTLGAAKQIHTTSLIKENLIISLSFFLILYKVFFSFQIQGFSITSNLVISNHTYEPF